MMVFMQKISLFIISSPAYGSPLMDRSLSIYGTNCTINKAFFLYTIIIILRRIKKGYFGQFEFQNKLAL